MKLVEMMISEQYDPCPATLQPAPTETLPMPTCKPLLIGRVSGLVYFFTSLHLPEWPSDLKYSPYPPARDWGCRVSEFVSERERERERGRESNRPIKVPFLLMTIAF